MKSLKQRIKMAHAPVNLPTGWVATAIRPEPYVKVNVSRIQIFLPSETLRILQMPMALVWYVDISHGSFMLESVKKEEVGAFKVSYIGNRRGAMITIPAGYRHVLTPGYYKLTDHVMDNKTPTWIRFTIQSKRR